jgi:hypothetical protein
MLKFSWLVPERVIAQAKMFGMNGSVKLLEALATIESQIKYAQNPLIFLETGLLKAMTPASIAAADAVERLEKLEKEMALLKRQVQSGETIIENPPQALADESARYIVGNSQVSEKSVPDHDSKIELELNKEVIQRSATHNDGSGVSSVSVNQRATDIDPEKVLRLWPEILSYLQKNNGRVYAFLVDGTPLKFEKGRLIVGFKADHELHIKKLKENANHRIVEEAFESVLGAPVGFVLEVITEASQQSKGSNTEDRIRALLGDMADLLEIQD